MKIIAYLLALNILIATNFPNQNLGELAKLFSLVDHWHHHETEKEIGFLDYLTLHYTDQQHHEQDHEEHKDLPFHSQHQTQNATIFSLFPLLRLHHLQPVFFLENTKQFSAYQFQCSNSFIADIWQPPKF